MRGFLYLKLFFLALTLGGVIYVMTHMNADAVARALAAFGVEAGTPESPGLMAAGRVAGPEEERFNICPNRVHSISFVKTGYTISEGETPQGRQWMLAQENPKSVNELSYMEVEKWFSKHCQIVIRVTEGGSVESLSPNEPIHITYIDGSKRTFVRSGNLFSEGSKRFESQDFAEALEELKRIAQIP